MFEQYVITIGTCLRRYTTVAIRIVCSKISTLEEISWPSLVQRMPPPLRKVLRELEVCPLTTSGNDWPTFPPRPDETL